MIAELLNSKGKVLFSTEVPLYETSLLDVRKTFPLEVSYIGFRDHGDPPFQVPIERGD